MSCTCAEPLASLCSSSVSELDLRLRVTSLEHSPPHVPGASWRLLSRTALGMCYPRSSYGLDFKASSLDSMGEYWQKQRETVFFCITQTPKSSGMLCHNHNLLLIQRKAKQTSLNVIGSEHRDRIYQCCYLYNNPSVFKPKPKLIFTLTT